MEISKRTPEEQAAVEADKASTHIAVVVHEEIRNKSGVVEVEDGITDAMSEINDRSLAAGMVILPGTLAINQSQSSCLVDGVVTTFLIYTVLAQWMDREKFGSLQRQQSIMGGPQPGRGGL